ncbi:ATP-binding protein [Aeromonas sp. A-5]|uniref:ATP-binding protein n=1 Tax=Aeromonas ichthyocola TaxID=3367746 RepID=UPI0038ED8B79
MGPPARRLALVGVDDQGPGDQCQAAAALFLPFEQFAVEGQLRAPGTGLGLAICKQLIEQMGGHIDVEGRGRPAAAASSARCP